MSRRRFQPSLRLPCVRRRTFVVGEGTWRPLQRELDSVAAISGRSTFPNRCGWLARPGRAHHRCGDSACVPARLRKVGHGPRTIGRACVGLVAWAAWADEANRPHVQLPASTRLPPSCFSPFVAYFSPVLRLSSLSLSQAAAMGTRSETPSKRSYAKVRPALLSAGPLPKLRTTPLIVRRPTCSCSAPGVSVSSSHSSPRPSRRSSLAHGPLRRGSARPTVRPGSRFASSSSSLPLPA